MKIDPDDMARSMKDPDVRERRRAMLQAPHMAPLTEFVERLRLRGKEKYATCEVPDFDPFDGGINAQVLFLFEKPGPMTNCNKAGRRPGSGFISRNNDDPTAEAAFRFMHVAQLPREATISWNAVPWWNGTRKISSAELREGVGCLEELLDLLPRLRALMFVGKKAEHARPLLESHRRLRLFSSAHPSPIVRASMRDRWNAIPSQWAEVRPALCLHDR